MDPSNEELRSEETSRIEETLTRLEVDLQERYCRMGKELLEIADSEQRAINNLVDQIIKIKKALAVVNSEIECPQCMAHNASDSSYCKHCGQPLDGENIKEDKKNGKQ